MRYKLKTIVLVVIMNVMRRENRGRFILINYECLMYFLVYVGSIQTYIYHKKLP